jgi:glycerophosphoryl diester phosphodiesterase
MGNITLGALGVYSGTSAVLLAFPALLHRQQAGGLDKRLVHASHRGGSAEAPENTLYAFRNAVAQGSDMLELDVHLTKDKEVVVHHDASLLHTTGIAVAIADLAFAELPPLRAAALPLPSFYHAKGELLDWRPEEGREQGQPQGHAGVAVNIPRLGEVFAACPASFINIDLKGSVPGDDETRTELRRRVHELIVQHGRQDRTAWGSFSAAVTDACHREDPSVHTYFSLRRTLVVVALFYTGLLPFFPLHEVWSENQTWVSLDLLDCPLTAAPFRFRDHAVAAGDPNALHPGPGPRPAVRFCHRRLEVLAAEGGGLAAPVQAAPLAPPAPRHRNRVLVI